MRNRDSAPIARHVVFLLLIVVLGTLYFLLSFNSVFFAPDEGATVYHFQKAAEGAVQHRDFYSVYGVGFYIFGGALFKIFGPGIIVTRVFVLLLKLAMAVLMYFVALRLVRPGFAFLGCLGFVIWWGDPSVPTPTFFYPSHISQLLGLLCVMLFFIYERHPRKLLIALAGLAVGLSCLFKPTMGILSLMAFFLFFFAREMLLDLRKTSSKSADGSPRQGEFLARAGIIVELAGMVGVAGVLFILVGGYGFDFPTFIFFLLPIYCVFSFVVIQGIRVLFNAYPDGILWKHHRETLVSCLILGGGVLLWQALQAGYFVGRQALGDFLHMLATAGDYYEGAARHLYEGTGIVTVCGGALLVILLVWAIMRITSSAGPRGKMVVALAATSVSLLAPISWYIWLNSIYRYHFIIWATAITISLLVSLFIVYRDSLRSLKEEDVTSLFGLLLVTVYAAANLLDAYTIIDTGHISQVLPPFLILLACLGQRFYDSWKKYMGAAIPGVGKIAAGAMTGILGVGLLLPSLYMMFMFRFITVPTSDRRWRLYEDKLATVPRSPVMLERARGISIHTLDGFIWIPPECPKTRQFLDVAGRVSKITRDDDLVFSTMGSSLMLYFLAERDGLSGAANCYVWQTVMGMTSSKALKEFSDTDLTDLIKEKQPAVIVVEDSEKTYAIETERFIANWPQSWSFILAHYHAAESIGPFNLYVPNI